MIKLNPIELTQWFPCLSMFNVNIILYHIKITVHKALAGGGGQKRHVLPQMRLAFVISLAAC